MTMEFKALETRKMYESPALVEVDVASEGILCESGSIDGFDWIEDQEGWN